MIDLLAKLGMVLMTHPELFEMLIAALEGGHITSEQATKAIQIAMVEANDAAMRKAMSDGQ